MRIFVLLFGGLLVAGFFEKSTGEKPEPLNGAAVERLDKEWGESAKWLRLESSSRQMVARAFKIEIILQSQTMKIRRAGQRVGLKSQ